MLKRTKISLALLACWGVLYLTIGFFSMVASLSGDICFSYNGFGVDDSGNIYLGYTDHIVVLDKNGEIVRKIVSRTKEMSDFLIVDNEYIYEYSHVRHLVIMDMDGKLISKHLYGEEGYQGPSSISRPLRTHTTGDGTVYESFSKGGRFEICRVVDGNYERIYRMPLFAYILKIIRIVLFAGFFVFIPLFIYCYNTDPKTPKNEGIFELFVGRDAPGAPK